MKLKSFSNDILAEFDQYLMEQFSSDSIETRLGESMRYSLSNGGKRVRPLLVLATIHALGGDIYKGFGTASALEAIHTYSLIHDDLPAMDDDDMRRGKLTNHKAFDEATAILAGDGLLTQAFKCISSDECLKDDSLKLTLVGLLSQAAGPEGMVGGQMADMAAENQQLTVDQLKSIHARKTGALIRFAVEAGAKIAQTDANTFICLQRFAIHFGVAYQIQNDLQEVLWSDEARGKNQSGDQSHHKNTYPALLTTAGAKDSLVSELAAAQVALDEVKAKKTAFDNELLYDFLALLRI